MSVQGTMSQEQPHRPLTYGDLFGAQGDLASMPVTKEDALMMQNAEELTTGQSKKDGPASTMQSAADKNLQSGAISPDTRTIVAEEGVVVIQLTTFPGNANREYIIAGQPVLTETRSLPTDPILAREGSITIGEALEAVALSSCDKPVEAIDARAIKSAEERATGVSFPMKDGIAATAQSAAELNPEVDDFAKTTIGDILTDASSELETDKLVTQEDARKVREAELRGQKGEGGQPGVIAAALQAAANMNTEM